MFMCFCCGLYNAIWMNAKQSDMNYYLGFDISTSKDYNFFYNLFVRFGSWMIIFTNLVPISLIVTLEFVKLIQGVYIEKD
jgi:phospholipid-transporting ATPase